MFVFIQHLNHYFVDLMYGVFIICFVLFLFVTCFGWNFNAMAAADDDDAAAL